MQTIAKPFTNMAISLSGGGYRASAFHLGALSYLHSVQYAGQTLFQRTTAISTISGGTLTGIMVALYMAEGRTFKDCYDKLYCLLKKDELIKKAFDKLNNTGNWTDKSRSKDLINAFAEVYDKDFYGGATFEKLFNNNNSHFQDVIFGATEFTTGIQFRFTENDTNGKFGNGKINLPDDVAANVRLGDAAAASSCFPGGFEPIIMAKDFSGGENGPISKVWQGKGYQPTAIMDGGIIDNQGIEGIELAEKRRSGKNGPPSIGTYIISDVAGKNMEPFEVPTIQYSRFKDFFTFRRVNLIVGLVLGLIMAALFYFPLCTLAAAVLSGFLTLGLAWFALFFWVKSKFLNTLHTTIGKANEPELFKNVGIFFKTPIYILVHLVKFRGLSVMKMVQDVFLRRIRRLQIDRLYDDKHWSYRVLSNNIYSLSDITGLSPAMTDAVQTANRMPTALWFTDQHKEEGMLDKLIACGQFSLCYNLIEYIEKTVKKKHKVWASLTPSEQAEIIDLCDKLKQDFELFKKDPLRMVKGSMPAC